MSYKHTYSLPIAWYPSTNGEIKVLASSAREVVYLKLSASALPAHVEVHDTNDVVKITDENRVWTLDASNTGNDNNLFIYPLNFKKGITVRVTQGGNGNPKFHMAIIPDQV